MPVVYPVSTDNYRLETKDVENMLDIFGEPGVEGGTITISVPKNLIDAFNGVEEGTGSLTEFKWIFLRFSTQRRVIVDMEDDINTTMRYFGILGAPDTPFRIEGIENRVLIMLVFNRSVTVVW